MRSSLLFLFLALGACAQRPDPLAEVLAQAAATQSTEPPPPIVHLRSPGRATADLPLRPLRYAFDRTKRWIRVDVKARKAMRTLSFELELEPLSIEGDGTMRFEFTVTKADLLDDDAEMTPDVVAKYQKTLIEVTGLFGTEQVTSRGIVKEFGWVLPKGTSLAAHQILVDTSRVLRQLYPTLPEEPVGLDAKWTTGQEMKSSAYTVQSETEWTVAAMQPSSVDLVAKYTQHADKQPFGHGKHPAQLLSLEGEGAGTFHLGLEPVLSAASMKLAIVAALDVPRDLGRSRLDMSTSSVTRWAPLEWAR